MITYFNHCIRGASKQLVNRGGYIQFVIEEMRGKAPLFPSCWWKQNCTCSKLGHGIKTSSVERSRREAHELCVA